MAAHRVGDKAHLMPPRERGAVLAKLTTPRRALCCIDHRRARNDMQWLPSFGGAPCPIANRAMTMVRISSRTWTLAQIEDLAALIDAGSTAANAAMALRRSITVVRAKARNLGTPFRMIA